MEYPLIVAMTLPHNCACNCVFRLARPGFAPFYPICNDKATKINI